MSVKSKYSSKRNMSIKKDKKKKIADSDDDFESSDEELDLTKECHPIGYYLKDRAEMINQMFSVIKGNKLKAMLPPVLKDYDIEQLKLQCLDQLLGMSEKRITCLLEGEILETSSESEVVESEESDNDEKNGTSGSSSNRSEDSQDECRTKSSSNKRKKRKGDSNNEGKGRKVAKTEADQNPEQGKTLLEILELEMRARAIRALLKQSGNEKESDLTADEPKAETNGVNEMPGEVVDLTECEDEEFLAGMKKEKIENEDFDKKVSNFEEKIEKSKAEKANAQENEKSKKLQAEFELRNKLFKKKIYRTRQQRMENEEEEKSVERNESEENKPERSEKVLIKQEPVEPVELVVEDPEEGEISTSEDEFPVEIKQEPPETIEPADDFETKVDNDAERVTAIDNGTFISNSNMENIQEKEKEFSQAETEDNVLRESASETNNVKDFPQSVEESKTFIEETSWRDRWLQKDGVQKLVKSSKIYAKVKKRIAEKSQKAKEEVPLPYEINSDSNSNSKLEMIEGSIEEYERLLGRNQKEKKEASLTKCGDSIQPTSSELSIEKEGALEVSTKVSTANPRMNS